MSNLISRIFSIEVISLHSGLSLSGISKYSFRDGEKALAILAVDTIKLESFIHSFLLPLDLDGDTLFIKLMLRNT